jgi:hypothetical protein
MTDEEWTKRQAAHKAWIEARDVLNARTVDAVNIGDEVSESSHRMKGENTQSGAGAYGQHMSRRFRHGASGGWFSYEMAVRPGQSIALLCTYWGKEVGPRTFDILVNGTVIATQTLDSNHPPAFYDVETPIPPELTMDAAKVTVTFRPHVHNTAGGLFGIRTVK